MISKLVGIIDYVDYHNMGLSVMLSNGVAYFVKFFYVSECEIGQKIAIHTVMLYREDSQTLWGFTELSDKKLFEILLDVDGIGPKIAFNIVHRVGVIGVVESVKTNKQSALKIPGLGDKLARKIISELSDMSKFKTFVDEFLNENFKKNNYDVVHINKRNELIDILINFGYDRVLIDKCLNNLDINEDIQVLIKKSLKLLINGNK